MNCLHPQTVYNSYLERYITVPCGKCECCLIQKKNILCLKLSNECQKHKYNIFFTLTYKNDYIPTCRLHSNIVRLPSRNFKISRERIGIRNINNGIDYLRPGEVLSTRDHPSYRYSYSFIDDFEIIDKYCDGFIDDDSSFYNLRCFDRMNDLRGFSNDCCGVLSKKDLNQFFKRLRYEIEKTEFVNEKLRYFVIGEYGGRYNRPHMHGIFHTNNWKFAEWLRTHILQIWRMADINACAKKNSYGRDGLPVYIDSTKVCSYVSKYVSLYDCCSKDVFRMPVKPFYLCSKFPYYGLSTFDENLVKNGLFDDSPVFEYTVKQGDEFVSLSASKNIENRIWRRFNGIDKEDIDSLVNLFTRPSEYLISGQRRFVQFIRSRVKEFFPSASTLTLSHVRQYIQLALVFLKKFRSFLLKKSMFSIDGDYLLGKIDTFSDLLGVKFENFGNEAKNWLLFNLDEFFNRLNLDIGNEIFYFVLDHLFNRLVVYQKMVLHDYRVKFRKSLLPKHMSNLTF